MFLGKKETEEPSNSVSTQLLSANSGGEHCNLAQKWKKTPKLENNNKHLGASAILIPTNPAHFLQLFLLSMRKTALLNCATPLLSRPFSSLSCFTPNRSLYRYSAICYREDNFLRSFIFLLASCFLLDFILRFLAMA